MHHQQGDGRAGLSHKIPVGNAVDAVEGVAVHAQRLSSHVPVDGIGGAGQCARAQRGYVGALGGVGQTPQIALQHHAVSQQMMAEDDGLCTLEVGIAGNDGIPGFLRLVANGADHLCRQGADLADLLAEPQAQIESHLIVSAAGGVQTLACIADAAGQFGLVEGMDILSMEVDLQSAALQIPEDAFQPGQNGLGVLGRIDALGTQHGGVRHAAGQILYRQTLIKANGGVEVVRDLVKMLCGAARPQFFHKNLELSLYYCSSHFFCRVA